ncbi:MAG TPA: ABC transporter substrate-binding protein, partial [Candidatus Caenarcaniphilales bacterium]
VDRPLLQKRVFQGQVEPLYSLVPTIFDAYQPVFQRRYTEGDTAKVQKLLAQAGYSLTQPLKLNLWYRSNISNNVSAATTLKGLAQQKLGGLVQFELSGVESATAYQNLDKGIYPLFMSDWYGDFFDPDNYLQPFLTCTQGTQAAGCKSGASQGLGSFYYSDRVNQLIDQERQEQNPQKRQQIFTQIQEVLAQDVPYIPLWQNKDYAFAQTAVKGLRLEPTQQFPFRTLKKSS